MESLGYCKVMASPVRSEASDRAEMVTQLVFGELAELLERKAQWMKIRVFADNYEGWIDSKQFQLLSAKEATRWQNGLTIETALIRPLQTPWGIQYITAGAFVPVDQEGPFKIGADEFRFTDQGHPSPKGTIEFARHFENAPYLWGGKTPFGVDCSGFIQTVFRYFDINLPRDASEQAEHGRDIPFGEQEAGDIAFFQNKDGKIHHVGLLVNAKEIIHASGWVRTDDFTAAGIVRKTNAELSHTFNSIKRL